MALTLDSARRLPRRVVQKLLKRTAETQQTAVPDATFRQKVASWLERLAGELRAKEPPLGRQGLRLQFISEGSNLGKRKYGIYSVRGNLYMGRVEYRNQWRAPAFYPDATAVYDQQCVAEIFAAMRDLK